MALSLHINGVQLERGGRSLFPPLTVSTGAGTLLYVRGANGAGKTTLLRALAGLASPSAGEVAWRQDGNPTTAAAATTFVGHANAMNDALSVIENLSYATSLAGQIYRPVLVGAALEQLGVFNLALRRVGTLSQGQRKRASLARLLLREQPGARAWLLDEPFVALDVDTQKMLEQLIAQELKAGAIVVLTSHQDFAIDSAKTTEVLL
ncbi:MAG: heme ABC exporter ATP-binding protein CcmA [Betaproteobacteria bacterium]|nr:MAG: heme ABC exporter ATP-binding protein CcmA [Betaproteobacteria bacterium]